jgi:signal transduction histidine kinase
MDITKRKQADAALREREAQLQAMLDVLPVGVFLCDREGRIIRSNPAAAAIWGAHEPPASLSQYRFRGKRPGSVREFQDGDWPLARAVWRGVCTAGEEIEIQTFDHKQKTVLNYAVPIRTEAGEIGGAVSVEFDITGRKQTEQALIKSEKLASVGRMAATIAHEINNPLAAVMNSLYLVGMSRALPQDVRPHLELAQRELERTAHITKQTLGFYREGASRSSTVRLPEVLEQILEIYASRLRNNRIQIERKRCTPCEVYGVEGEVRQIVSNLVANSIDAMPQGGVLYVRTCSVKSGERPMSSFVIADTGGGIAPEHFKQIFEPFFTTKQSIGTGLGLWVTRELVRKNNGKIRIRSKLGRGTVVTIWLPTERRREDRNVA